MQIAPYRSLLLMDLYELTMAQSYLEHKPRTHATFDLFVRKLPRQRSYLVFAGLTQVVEYLQALTFSKDDIAFLKSLGYFSDDFLSYLLKFSFHGDVAAMREGEVFFANEPVLRLTGSLIEVQIIESFLLNTINLATMIASKASRITEVAPQKGLYDFSLRRTHGKDAALAVARSSFIAGFQGTSNVLAAKLYGIPAVGTMAHSFVMTFGSEIEAFRAFAATFPQRSVLLVDTYNSLKGVAHAIILAKELAKKGYTLKGIRLDSGDLLTLSKHARRMLDGAGLNSVRIFASGDLDEYKIQELVRAKAAIDDFGVGTNMGTSCDAPYLDVIYKISEVTDSAGKFLPTMKLSERKVTYPGRKQVYRTVKNGYYVNDTIALENERVKGAQPLLRQVMKGGKLISNLPSLAEIQMYRRICVSKLPKQYRELKTPNPYPVSIGAELRKAVRTLSRALRKRSI